MRELELLFCFPVDVEWAWHGGAVSVLQASRSLVPMSELTKARATRMRQATGLDTTPTALIADRAMLGITLEQQFPQNALLTIRTSASRPQLNLPRVVGVTADTALAWAAELDPS